MGQLLIAMFFASASHSVSPTTSASHARIDLSSRRFTGRRSVLSSRRPLGGVSDAHNRRVGSRIDDVSVVAAAAAAPGADDEIAMLTKMLQLAKERKEHEATAGDEQKTASKGGYDGASFNVKTFNAIAPTGLEKFPRGKYEVAGEENDLPGPPMAIMLRSHKLQVSEVKPTVRAIVRCGAGTNNIPVKEMCERGIPVFNTPGANANAVKELVVCGLLLASRGILEGANHVKNVINVEENGEL